MLVSRRKTLVNVFHLSACAGPLYVRIMVLQNIQSFLALSIVGIISLSCMWDNDTVEMERQRFPEVIELISGKFLRHSPEFYYWKVRDRSLKIQQFPDSLSLYDDLAVAHSKLGNDSAAIALMLQKEALSPGLYETYANLGTFYIHDGQLETGLAYIKKAIEINPDAHFGREVYQQYVVEYVLQKRKENSRLFPLAVPVMEGRVPRAHGERELMGLFPNNFYAFLAQKDSLAEEGRLPKEALEKAVKGIKGMMKFGNADSPVLLEVLGDLLLSSNEFKSYPEREGRLGSAKHLAARAYLKAGYLMEDDAARQAYYQKAIEMLLMAQPDYITSLEHLHEVFSMELGEGKKFYDKNRAVEINWLQQGLDPEAEFSSLYYTDAQLSNRGKWVYDGVGHMRKSLKTTRETGRYGNAQMDTFRLVKTTIPDTSLVHFIDSAFQAALPPEASEGQASSEYQVPNWLFALLALGMIAFFFHRLRSKERS